jgi:riboflavin transporter FmnP
MLELIIFNIIVIIITSLWLWIRHIKNAKTPGNYIGCTWTDVWLIILNIFFCVLLFGSFLKWVCGGNCG